MNITSRLPLLWVVASVMAVLLPAHLSASPPAILTDPPATINDQDYQPDATAASSPAATSHRLSTSVQSLSGTYMAMGYTTATIAVRYWVKIQVTADNQVRIKNLLGRGGTVTGTYNPTTGILSIPPQIIFTDSEYGDFTCYAADVERKIYYSNRDIEFKLGSDGSLTTGNWGAFITSGPNAGTAMIRHREILYPARGVMTDYSLSGDSTNSYPVVVVRENNNKLLIKNFYNYGADVVLTVDSTGTVLAPRTKLAMGTSSTGSTLSFYNYAVTNYVSPTSLKLATTGVPGQWSGTTIELSRWAVSSSTTVSAIYDLLEKSVIEVPDTFLPFSSRLTLPGAGTPQNPYLVQTAADLANLSAAVNYAGGYTVSKKAFTGIHFRQTADIDMASIPNFEPIGYAAAATFCGIYDGNGHTISNLNIDRRSEANAALFGIVGKEGQVLNLTLTRPHITSEANNVAAVAADFQGYASNIHVRDAQITSTGSYVAGVLGKLTGVLVNTSSTGTIKGGNYIGGILGQGNGSLRDAYSAADITIGKKSAICGGLAGTLAGADTATMRNLHFDGSILDTYGSTTIGGLTGYFQNGSMTDAWFSGRIYSRTGTTNTTIIGGLTGLLAGASITNALNSGWLESPDAATLGTLAGVQRKRVGSGTDASLLENALVNGMVVYHTSAADSLYVGEHLPTLTQQALAYNSQLLAPTATPGALSIAALTCGTLPEALPASAWLAQQGRYPMLKAFAGSDAATLASAPFYLDAADHCSSVKKDFRLCTEGGIDWYMVNGGAYSRQGHGLRIADDGFARLTASQVECDTLVAFKGNDLFKIAFLKIQPKEYEGEGTAENPYLLKSAADIMRLRNAVDYQGMRYTGVHFRLAADLDFSNITDFIGFSSQGEENAFNGIFDGAGHAIRNWHIDRARIVDGRPTIDNASQLMAAFFLYTGKQAIIRNLTIDSSCSVLAGSHVAALVSQNAGRIEHCRNFATVQGLFNETGGLVACNAADATISHSYNAGFVAGGRSVIGGIVGANLGNVIGCQNDGYVLNDSLSYLSPAPSVMSVTGGIAGYNYGTMTQCLASGEVRGPGSVGTMIGVNRETGIVTASLATGVLHDAIDPDKHGAIMGMQNNTTDTVTNLYYDCQLTAANAARHASLPGVAPLLTAELVSGCLPAGLDASLWSTQTGRYPVLAAFASEPEALFRAGCYLLLDTAANRTDSRFHMRRNAPLLMAPGASACMAANQLTIAAGTLSIPAGVTELADTLIFTDGSRSKHLPLFVPGAILASGDGSEPNPYLISCAADWNRVATLAADHALSFRDDHFRLSADINFATTALMPICRDGITRFQGDLDGDGHALTGVTLVDSTATGNNLAPIGILGEYGTIRNLTLDATSRIAGYTNAGGIAGQSAGLILNCHNHASVSASNTYSGGLTGYIITGARFINCSNTGSVYVKAGQCGGIAGGGSDIGGIVSNCHNSGNITSADRSAGGIVGSARVDIRNCSNSGSVRALNIYAGGIAGYFTYAFDIDSCLNTADVTAQNGAAGGIVGYMFSGGNISRCVNRGEIMSQKTWAGGIIGNTYHDNTRVTDCSNYGTVTASTTHAGGIVGALVQGSDSTTMNYLQRVRNYGTVTAGTNYAGGIVGEAKAYTRLFNVRNYAAVNGAIYVGGIAGCLLGQGDTLFNSGAVTASKYTVGGLAGTTSTAATITAAISNGLNTGSVSSTGTSATTAYNIGGILGGGNIKLTNCVNTADVAGYKSVGGLVGLSVKGVSSASSGLNLGTCIYHSFNLGSVTCLAEANAATCGHITGSSTTALTYTEYAGNYYDLQYSGREMFAADSLGTPLSTAAFATIDLSEGYTLPASGGYPMLKAFAGDPEGWLASAAVMVKEGFTRHSVKGSCRLAAPQGVSWSSPHFRVDNGHLTWEGLTPGIAYRVTATSGDLQRHFSLAVDETTGIITISDEDGSLPVATEWYAPDGSRLLNPAPGSIAIRVDRYASGHRSSTTVIVR